MSEIPLTPDDLEHLDGLQIDDGGTSSISLVRDPGTGQVFVEILHGLKWGDRYALVPVDVDPARVGSWEDLHEVVGVPPEAR